MSQGLADRRGRRGPSSRSTVDVVSFTGDRDLFQLVDDARGVRVPYPIKGMGTLQLTDNAQLMEKYGVTGAQYGVTPVRRHGRPAGRPERRSPRRPVRVATDVPIPTDLDPPSPPNPATP
ncbi:hypothetical protein ABH940_000764 [Streptacidiphilus sp. BW17]